MALAGDTPTQRIEQLILLTRRLTELLDQESKLFAARRPQDAKDITEEKMRLSTLYHIECQDLKANQDTLMTIPDDVKAMLKSETERFNTSLNKNGQVVTAAQTVTEGLIHAIAEEVAQSRNKHTGYGPNAQLNQNDRSRLGVTIDRSA